MLPINVVVPFCKKDRADAVRLLEWIAELGKVDAQCVLVASEDCAPRDMKDLAFKAFTTATLVIDYENIDSNWKGEFTAQGRSASGPNSIFRQVAWDMHMQKRGPWLFLEPDAVPMRKGWLEEICEEYARCGKPFMGARVDESTHPGSVGVILHMSGVAVWPQATPQLAPTCIQPSDLAFDVLGAREIVPQAHFTDLIFHRFRGPTMATQQQVEASIPKSTAIYHASKDGSLIRLLRERNSNPMARVLQEASKPMPVNWGAVVEKASDAQPTVDIFIRTYRKDYEWLDYCLQSIEKFAKGFRQVVIVSTDTNFGTWFPGPKRMDNIKVVVEPQIEPGYLHQQKVKLYADSYSDADYFVYLDSDCVLTREMTPKDFFHEGLPVWVKEPWNPARPDESKTWAPVMQKYIGTVVWDNFMVEHPAIIPRWALSSLRQHCKFVHRKELGDYIMDQAVEGNPLALTFSEFNVMGVFLSLHHPTEIAWRSKKDRAPLVRQFWSHGGMKPEHRAEMEKILSDPVHVAQGEPAKGEYLPAETHGVVSMQAAIAALVSEARKDGFAKGRVLKALKASGLVRGGKLPPEQAKAATSPTVRKGDGILMCVQTYPGASEGFYRHLPYYQKSGATRIVGITTTDGLCVLPKGIQPVEIGENKYISGPHLPQRYIDILKWCLTQYEDHFIISEWDVLYFSPIRPWEGICLVPAGGKLPDSKASTFFHCPHLIDRASAERLIPEMEAIIAEGHCKHQWPEASPDVFLSFAIDRCGLDVNQKHFTSWTRNSLDIPGDLELACEASKTVDTLHGVKKPEELAAIERSLKLRVKGGK